MAFRLLLLSTVCLVAEAAIPQDEINGLHLPGWNKPLPSKQYSGYIEIDAAKGNHLHYWFVESMNNPANDPVVLWLNGGPACSSLDGFFHENGPLHFKHPHKLQDGNIPTLIENPWTWARIANMIYLESPVGVGLSYSSTIPKKDLHYTDQSTRDENYEFLVKWFEKFPEYKQNDFYITGESYAGIYIPMLVDKITQMKEANLTHIPLKAFAIGNGCVGNTVGSCSPKGGLYYRLKFYHGHGLYPNNVYQEINQECGFDYINITTMNISLTENCRHLVRKALEMVGRINIYDVYASCYESNASVTRVPYNSNWTVLLAAANHCFYGVPQGCMDSKVIGAYLDNAKVRKAIHVLPESEIGRFVTCCNVCNDNYERTVGSLLPLYTTLIKTYRTLIYNGDVDSCVPYNGAEQWTSGLGFDVKTPWRPWIVDNQVAGYVTEYAVNNFKFLTVKGAGHMVPQYRPKFAYYMFERFLHNKPM